MSYDDWKTRSDRDEDPTNGGTEEPCERCGQQPAKFLTQFRPHGQMLCRECFEELEQGYEPPFINPANDF